tara:strand:+ start:3021 stop:3665 length:645 start_codon:yes stop_codon:yes gene_type:complete
MPKLIKKEVKDRAMQMLAEEPNASLASVADACGIGITTLKTWKADAGFNEAVYTKYMSTSGFKMTQVMDAAFREAKLGNVSAMRLWAEMSGKLVKRISIKNESPYEKFINMSNIEDAEVMDYEITSELPERDTSNDKPRVKAKKERESLNNAIKRGYKKEVSPEQRAKNRKKSLESYKRQQRAKKVGLEPLGRRTGQAREEWYAELDRREKENR